MTSNDPIPLMRAKMLSSLQSATRVYIGDEGAQALASVLSQTSIHTLHLEGNSIRDAGAQAIAGVVSQTSINTLTVSYNRIGAAGAQALASVLSQTCIGTLNLGGPRI